MSENAECAVWWGERHEVKGVLTGQQLLHGSEGYGNMFGLSWLIPLN